MKIRQNLFIYIGLAFTISLMLFLPLASAAGPYAYITNWSKDNVSVVNLSSNTIATTIAVHIQPCGIVVSPDGMRVYCVNGGTGGISDISVINTTNNSVVTHISTGVYPYGIAINPTGTRVYVGNDGSNANNVSVIDTTSNTVIATIKVGTFPLGIVVNPQGTRVYVANRDTNNISIIDTATNILIGSINTGNQPWGIDISPDGSVLYEVNYMDDTVSAISTANNSILYTVAVGNRPTGIVVTPDGKKVYITNYGASSVSVLNTTTRTVTNLNAGSNPYGIAVKADGESVYAVSRGNDRLSQINTSNDTVVATISMGTGVWHPVSFGKFIGPLLTSPVTNFTSNATSGILSLTVGFTDTSANFPKAWNWNFGDNTTSTQRNPTHTYNTVGTYNVTLTSSNVYGNNTTTKISYITINKAIPVITWNPMPVTYPCQLSSTQLNATASVAGAFTYNPSSGTNLNAGNYTLNCTFIPTDTTNYTTVLTSVNFTVNKYNSIITWNPSPTNFTYGYPLNPGQLGASGGAAAGIITFKYNNSLCYYGQLLPAGSNLIVCNLTPYNTIDFTNNSTQKVFTVNKATPIITWNISSPILYLTPLSNVQLNATSNIAGNFSYDPVLGTVLPLGVNTLNVTFNPIDSANYSSVTKNTSITVYQESPINTFSVNMTDGIVPLIIQFTDNSTGFNNTYQWDFGDGSPNSTDQNPIHVYTFGNIQYNVTETVTNSGGMTTTQKINYIHTFDPIPIVYFSANVTNVTYPQLIYFVDPSIGENITSYDWDFGDDSYANGENQTHLYATGTYTVILGVTNNGGTGFLSRYEYINVVEATPTLNWSTPDDITYGTPLSDIQLNATASVAGDFVYDPPIGTILNVGHQQLNVTFTPDDITNYTIAYGNVTINVNPLLILPIANFGVNRTSGYVPLTVKFTDSSQYATSWQWRFGDGTANSTQQSPVHTFTTAGSRQVILTAINSNGTNSKSRTITVMSQGPVRPVANFNMNVATGIVPFDVQFTDTSTNTPTSWQWNFGDGNTSTTRNPIHTYSTIGIYTVVLIATNNAGSGTRTNIVTANEEPLSITFYQKQSRPSDTLDNLDVNTSGVTSSRTSSAFGNITSSIANYLSFGTIFIIVIGAYLLLQYLGII